MNDHPSNESSNPNTDLTTNDKSDSEQSLDPKTITNSSSPSQTPDTQITARIDDRKTMYAARRQSQWMAFILAIVFSSFGVYLVINGHPKTGGTMATVTVVALVGVFLTGQLVRPKQSTPEQEENKP